MNSHALLKGKKIPVESERQKNAERTRKKKEKRKSRAEALQSCDRGSHPM